MLFALALLVFCLAACLFAFVKGGSAERIGAAIILLNLLTATTNYRVFGSQIIDLTIDGVTAAAMLIVALRYGSVWLGTVMLVYALQFTLHAAYFVLERPRDELHLIVNNANSVAIGLCLAVATMVGWMRRRRAVAV
jgi:hypothetical protein